MKTVTIGGNRLGAGKQMRQTMKGYERSTHNLNTNLVTTMSAGTLVPFWNQIGLPDDTFDLEINADVITGPTVGPQFDSFKVQMDVFEIPFRLYIALLHNNALNIGRKMSDVKIPQMYVLAGKQIPVGEFQVNPSCILSYLGINGVGRIEEDGDWIYRTFSALGLLGYWDIYKTYYANKQEEIGVAIHNPLVAEVEIEAVLGRQTGVGIPQYPASGGVFIPKGDDVNSVIEVQFGLETPVEYNVILYTNYGIYYPEDLFENITIGTDNIVYRNSKSDIAVRSWGYQGSDPAQPLKVKLTTFPLENIDEMRNELLTTITQYNITESSPAPYSYALQIDPNNNTTAIKTQEGLGIKCYQSDKYNNWIETEWIDGDNGVNAVSAVAVVDEQFSIDQLNIANKVYNLLNRIAISDGSYKAWIETVYDTDFYMQCTSPVYVGGLSKELEFQKIISNSSSEANGTEQPLGTYASLGRMGNKHKGGHIRIKTSEPSYLMGIISITPRIRYSQGNEWYTNLKTLDDLHKPQLDEIGFQDLITDQMNSWDTSITQGDPYTNPPTFKSAGKQPAWINYMTDTNKAKGNFAIKDNLMFMTLNRQYDVDTTGITDVTTYIDPVKYNYIFADTSLDSMNFWVEVDVKCTARRKMSAKQIPNL